MDTNLVKRIAVAAVGIPLALLVVWYGSWPFAILVAVIAVLGTRETYILGSSMGIHALRATGGIAAALLPILVYAALSDLAIGRIMLSAWRELMAIWLMVILLLALRFRGPQDRPLAAVALTVFGFCYAAALLTFVLEIRHSFWPSQSWPGAAMVFFPLAVTWVCDTAAMFGGRAFGGAKLAPSISPGKTKSGAIAGVIGALAVAPIFTMFVFPRFGIEMSLLPALMMAALLAMVGQAGDLVESLFKRDAGVKDSSNLIPGHGGILDRFDSLYFVIPTAAICYRILGLT